MTTSHHLDFFKPFQCTAHGVRLTISSTQLPFLEPYSVLFTNTNNEIYIILFFKSFTVYRSQAITNDQKNKTKKTWQTPFSVLIKKKIDKSATL